MFRKPSSCSLSNSSFPRIRGDVPFTYGFESVTDLFSPHTRGCSRQKSTVASRTKVFPAYAGMFRQIRLAPPTEYRFPRIRGDVPVSQQGHPAKRWFSPHTRGCSCYYHHRASIGAVFPAYAGMFPAYEQYLQMRGGFPRIRGDVPSRSSTVQIMRWFSPHTRGCSAVVD